MNHLGDLMRGLRVDIARLSGSVEVQGKTFGLKMKQVGHDAKNIKAALPAPALPRP